MGHGINNDWVGMGGPHRTISLISDFRHPQLCRALAYVWKELHNRTEVFSVNKRRLGGPMENQSVLCKPNSDTVPYNRRGFSPPSHFKHARDIKSHQFHQNWCRTFWATLLGGKAIWRQNLMKFAERADLWWETAESDSRQIDWKEDFVKGRTVPDKWRG